MNITDYLFVALFLLQSACLFWLWRRVQMIESERVVEAATFDHLQRQISSLQRSLQEARQAPVPPPPPVAAAEPARPQRRQQPLASTEGASPYNQAIELFKRGFSATEVAERCGISRSEAELILSLYRNSPTA